MSIHWPFPVRRRGGWGSFICRSLSSLRLLMCLCHHLLCFWVVWVDHFRGLSFCGLSRCGLQCDHLSHSLRHVRGSVSRWSRRFRVGTRCSRNCCTISFRRGSLNDRIMCSIRVVLGRAAIGLCFIRCCVLSRLESSRHAICFFILFLLSEILLLLLLLLFLYLVLALRR